MKGNSRSLKTSRTSSKKTTRTSTGFQSTSKLSGMLSGISSMGSTQTRSISTLKRGTSFSQSFSPSLTTSTSSNNSSILSNNASTSSLLATSARNYITKHTHFHTWKPEKKVSKKIQEARAARDAVRIFSKEQFERTRKPFGVPVITRKPIEQRNPTNLQILKSVDQQELTRLQQLPREIDPFNVGDQVAVTALLSMSENKTQVYKGTVIQSTRGHGLHGRFTLRNNSDGGFYEVTFPFWSPFLRKIELIQKDPEPLVGKTKQGLYHRTLPADHPKNKVL